MPHKIGQCSRGLPSGVGTVPWRWAPASDADATKRLFRYCWMRSGLAQLRTSARRTLRRTPPRQALGQAAVANFRCDGALPSYPCSRHQRAYRRPVSTRIHRRRRRRHVHERLGALRRPRGPTHACDCRRRPRLLPEMPQALAVPQAPILAQVQGAPARSLARCHPAFGWRFRVLRREARWCSH